MVGRETVDERMDVTRDKRSIHEKYKGANSRLIIIDYDGVLVPEQHRPGFTIPSRETKAAIQQLVSDSQNVVMLMSGRDKPHLELHWSLFDVVLVAEYGAQFRDRRMGWTSLFDIDDSWIEHLESAMQTLPFQYDGSFLDRRTHSIGWHFMPTSADTVRDVPKIIEAIRTLPGANAFEVYCQTDRVELAPRGVDPGSFLARWIGGRKFDLVIAVGAGRMEESLFRILTRESVTVSVSPAISSTARYCLSKQADVVPFLRSLPGTV
jgi:trehalose 6-phosphate synthase/phosphatase